MRYREVGENWTLVKHCGAFTIFDLRTLPKFCDSMPYSRSSYLCLALYSPPLLCLSPCIYLHITSQQIISFSSHVLLLHNASWMQSSCRNVADNIFMLLLYLSKIEMRLKFIYLSCNEFWVTNKSLSWEDKQERDLQTHCTCPWEVTCAILKIKTLNETSRTVAASSITLSKLVLLTLLPWLILSQWCSQKDKIASWTTVNTDMGEELFSKVRRWYIGLIEAVNNYRHV